ncbi:MAG: T9SS type A sorting domain-containing protein, partial [Bacteroidia bacterium]
TGSITDSPIGLYATNTNKSTTTTAYINLTDAIAAYLQFEARWEVERGYDYVEIQATTDDINFYPLCGKYTHTGNSNQDDQQPLYDGIQDAWLHETIDLSDYLGQNIKLRFNLVSDAGVDYDGLYFDDISVKKIVASTNGISQYSNLKSHISLYPNPSSGNFVLAYNASTSSTIKITITNILGEEVYTAEQNNVTKTTQLISLPNVASGTYFVRVQDATQTYIQKIVINK